MVNNIQKYQSRMGSSGQDLQELVIGRKEFKELIFENIVLISRALRHQFIIPDFKAFTDHIADFYEVALANRDGAPADYIPQLAKQDPDVFGISLCTVDGQRFSIGHADYAFTLQSCRFN